MVLTLADTPWQILKDVMLFFLCTIPNLVIVILAMDEINCHFSSIMADMSYSPAIQYALQFMKKTLNKYYSLTDSSGILNCNR